MGHAVIVHSRQELQLQVLVGLVRDDVAQGHAAPARLSQQCQVTLEEKNSGQM